MWIVNTIKRITKKDKVRADEFVIKEFIVNTQKRYVHFNETFGIDLHRSQNKRLIYLHKSNYISFLL